MSGTKTLHFKFTVFSEKLATFDADIFFLWKNIKKMRHRKKK